MPNKMLVDAAHPEETRVVVLRGSRVEEFDFESASRKQLRGNIYLAKVTRVEPSLQAAFIDYGGNRHGFLAFSEIHPDYYQIPVADRQALIEAEEAEIAEAEARANERERGGGRGRGRGRGGRKPEAAADAGEGSSVSEAPSGDENGSAEHTVEHLDETNGELAETVSEASEGGENSSSEGTSSESQAESNGNGHDDGDHVVSDDEVESVGAEDALEELPDRRKPRAQDSGSDQAPPGAARPGRQGRAWQQGRGADHLPVARRPLFRAHAEHGAGRRNQPQDHVDHRPQTPEAGRL